MSITGVPSTISTSWMWSRGQDIRGAVQYLKQSSKKVAVGGFCMCGALTILVAVRVPEMAAGACFYGIPLLEAADLKKIKIPLICHFANKDDWCTTSRPRSSSRNQSLSSIATTRSTLS